jgi:hypothetical protein
MAGGVKLQEQSDSKAHRLLYFQEPTLGARNLRPEFFLEHFKRRVTNYCLCASLQESFLL